MKSYIENFHFKYALFNFTTLDINSFETKVFEVFQTSSNLIADLRYFAKSC